MARIPTFDARAPRRGSLEPSADTGAVDALGVLARASFDFSARIGDMARRAAVREGAEAGQAAALQVSMPKVDFAFDGKTAATRPVSSTRGMSGDIRKLVSDAAVRHGVDPNALLTTAMLESSGNPKAKNPSSSAGGLFQFIDATAKQYGLADRFDPVQASDAAARLMRDNAGHLRRALGREPTAAELYLAHQQGAGGAAKLLTNPAGDAAATVGADAVRLNGGRAGMTNAEFAGLWLKKAGGGGPAPAPAGEVRVAVTGSAGPMPRMEGDGAKARAFNEAAANLYLNRLDTGMRQQMEALALQHEDDPAGLAEALDAMRAGLGADLPAREAAVLDDSFSRARFALVRGAAERFNKRVQAEEQESFEANIAARTTTAYRLASRTGSDEAGDAALSAEISAIGAEIDRSGMTPARKAALKAKTAEDLIAARMLSGLEGIEDPAGRAGYVKQFQDDWAQGEGIASGLGYEQYERVNEVLLRRLNADEVAARKRAGALETAIGGRLSALRKGYPVPDAERRQLAEDVAAAGDPVLSERLAHVDRLTAWQGAHLGQRPEVVEAQIGMVEAKMREVGWTQAGQDALDVMDALAKEMRKGLAEDPLGWAQRAGVAAIEPIDFANAGALSASLTERVSDAAAVAGHYGVAPRYFSPAEADSLRKMVEADPLQLPSLVSGLSAGLGEATPAALAEISKDAPVLAHVAGLTHATGAQRVPVEIAEQLAWRKDPAYRSQLPTPARLDAAATEVLSGALDALPRTQQAAVDTAAVLFERRLRARGLTAESFATDGDPARALFAEALDEALGATMRDGVKFGGVAQVNGWPTIAPPHIAADGVQDMLDDLAADDLLFQQALGTANGVPVDLSTLRRGRLVMTGPGRYRIATGDMAAGDPRYVPNADGGYFELDLAMLALSQERRGRRNHGTLWIMQ